MTRSTCPHAVATERGTLCDLRGCQCFGACDELDTDKDDKTEDQDGE